MTNPKLEVCAYSLKSAIRAQEGGADRVELCTNMYEGGTTPSYADIKLAHKKLQIDFNVMIRPRGGDFYYSALEYELMKTDIKNAKDLGANGVVFGILKPNGAIDSKRTEELVELAFPLSVTFHRAFDKVRDPFIALSTLKDIGVNRVLTSGLQKTAFEGKETIKKLVEDAGDEIIIMPGGGINSSNVLELLSFTGVKEIHLSGKKLSTVRMEYDNDIKMNSLEQIPENRIYETDPEIIKEIVTIINNRELSEC